MDSMKQTVVSWSKRLLDNQNSHSYLIIFAFQYIESPVKCSNVETFQCLENSVCIPQRKVCDGKKDCSDGSDESVSLCGKI